MPGRSQRLPLRVLVAPMASGSAVISDPSQWGELKAMGVRKIAAIEMEAATIATIAQARGLPWIVAKGVMDHADTKKDDRYKQFDARASAQVMFALLAQLMDGEDAGARYAGGLAEQEAAPATIGRAGDSRARVSEPDPVDIVSWLDSLAASDPTPDAGDRVNGRLYLVVHPAGTVADALAEVSTTSTAGELNAAIQRAVAARVGPPFSGPRSWCVAAPQQRHGQRKRCVRGRLRPGGLAAKSLPMIKA